MTGAEWPGLPKPEVRRRFSGDVATFGEAAAMILTRPLTTLLSRQLLDVSA